VGYLVAILLTAAISGSIVCWFTRRRFRSRQIAGFHELLAAVRGERSAPAEIAEDWKSGSGVGIELAEMQRRFTLARRFERAVERPGFEELWADLQGRMALGDDPELLRLRLRVLDEIADAVMITDPRGVIQWTNAAFTQITGFEAGEVAGRTPRLLRSGLHTTAFYRRLWARIRGGRVWRGEVYNRRKDGRVYAEEMSVTPLLSAPGEISHFVAVKRNVSARKRWEGQIRRLALHDPLTNLPNRRLLDENLSRVIARAQRGHPSALVLIDLDDFKRINDTLGHPAGDQLLITLSRVLRRALRPSDLLVRLGGDEFAVLLENTPLDDAGATAQRVLESVEGLRFTVQGHAYGVGASVGVAAVEGSLPPSEVYRLADAALYAAKARGKHQVVMYHDLQDGESALTELTRRAEWLRTALRREQLELHLQPVYRLDTGRSNQYEALTRLLEEDGSLCMPGTFLPIAEQCGLMPAIDRWMIRNVIARAESHPHLRFSVNIAGQSLADEELLAFVESQLGKRPDLASRLLFEVPEAAAVGDLEGIQEGMTRLQRLGCRVVLDDFGTGFSSFLHLRQVPADCVKIDGSFVRNLEHNPEGRAIVQAVTLVAHALGKQVMAEWVESEAAADILSGYGVELGQGHLWGHARSEECLLAA
jgi:diguanylate cyclase (GGDEF)-like protein/PAS domain S-box-containing protein